MWFETRRPGAITPRSTALTAALFIQRSAVAREALMSLSPCPTSPNSSALVSAILSSGCTGTILGLLPFPSRTWRLGSSPSKERSRASSARASETLRPARHSIRNSSLALGFGAARISASTWWGSRYSGSFFVVRLPTVGVPGFGVLALGYSVARDYGLFSCHGRAPGRLRAARHLVRAIVSSWAGGCRV